MTFTKPWGVFPSDDGNEIHAPLLDVSLLTAEGNAIQETFVVDSGADISMGPRRLCGLLGLDWDSGTPVELRGISPREECKIRATIHQVEILVREVSRRITIPFCFAEGD